MVCVCCVGCGMEDGVEVESGVVFGVMCGEGGERVRASCANVCVLIVLRNLLLYPRVLSAVKSVLMACWRSVW